MRVISNPAYPGRRTTIGDAVERLRRFTESGGHRFWPDDLSLLDADAFDHAHLGGHAEVTATYLLALAVRRGGALATFDRAVRVDRVRGASPEALVVLEGDPAPS